MIMKIPAITSFTIPASGLVLSVCLLGSLLRAETPPETPPVETKPAESTAAPVAIGAEVGTAGFGPVVIVTASKNFTATLGYTWLSYTRNTSSSDADYDGKLKFSNVQAILNWHPFAGGFHVSAGAFLSDNKVTVAGKPKGDTTYDIGNTTYTAAQVGTLSGNVKLAKGAVPYVGLGWAKKPLNGGFGAFFDVGVLISSTPKASLSATGPIASDPTFQANLQTEEQSVNSDLKSLRYYPVLQFGVLYRF
jgi:hypothetical protein